MANVELDIWKGEWGLASMDLECLRVLTYMKLIGVPVRVRETSNPFFSPTGALPVLRDGRKLFTTFDEVVDYLKSLHFSTDVQLDGVQAGEVSAFTQYLRDKLWPALQLALWADERNYSEVTRPAYSRAAPLPLGFYYPGRYRARAQRLLDALHGDHADPADVERTVYAEADKCLRTLSERLGESEFFFGSRPVSFDATVFAYLAPLVHVPLPNGALQAHMRAHANLTRFVARIDTKLYRHIATGGKPSSGTQARTGSGGAGDAEFPHRTRNKLLAALFAAIAMAGYAVANGLFQVGARDELEAREYRDLFEHEDDDN